MGVIGQIEAVGSSLVAIEALDDQQKQNLSNGLVDTYISYLSTSLAGMAINRQDALEILHRAIQEFNKRSLQGAL